MHRITDAKLRGRVESIRMGPTNDAEFFWGKRYYKPPPAFSIDGISLGRQIIRGHDLGAGWRMQERMRGVR